MRAAIVTLGVCALVAGFCSLSREGPFARAGQVSDCAPLLVNPTGTSPGVVIQDMNGDGRYDAIAEAIRLLNWHFAGGLAPIPPCAGSRVLGLPETGQTTCYDTDGNEMPCDEAPCPGQDGSSETGCSWEDRFVDNGDGTVSDTCTGLMWLQETVDVDGDGEAMFETDRLTWCEALQYCENLTFAGHDDWRLPNIRELQSCVDHGRIELLIDSVFGGVPSAHWSSTSSAADARTVWAVHFGVGDSYEDPKAHAHHFRAVRSE